MKPYCLFRHGINKRVVGKLTGRHGTVVAIQETKANCIEAKVKWDKVKGKKQVTAFAIEDLLLEDENEK